MEDNKIKKMLNKVEPSDELEKNISHLKFLENGNTLGKEMQNANDNIKSNDRESDNKRKIISLNKFAKVAAGIGIFAIVSTGTAYAATQVMGLKDIVNNIPEDAEQYINTEIKSELVEDNLDSFDKEDVLDDETMTSLDDMLNIKPIETLSDGNSCFVALEVSLDSDNDYVLLPNYYSVQETCSFDDAQNNESFGEYAKRLGKMIIKAKVDYKFDETKLYDISMDEILVDSTHSIMYVEVSDSSDNSNTFADGSKLNLEFYAKLYENPTDEINWKIAKDDIISVTIENAVTDNKECYYALPDNQEMRIEDSSVIIKSIKVVNTELETKVYFEVINEDEETGNWIAVNLVDDNGDYLENGVTGGASINTPDENGGFTYPCSYKKMEFPDHVNVMVKYLETEEKFFLMNIPVSK